MTGRTVNVISLAGVAFAIGLTLDNNIVVLENIYRHLQMGKQRLQAALEGVREVWPAVLAATLTTVCVFLPVIFIEEEAGQLYSDIAITVSASILMSMLVAIALVPATAGRLLTTRPEHARPPLLTRLGTAFARSVLTGVRWCANGIVRPAVTIATVVGMAAAIIIFLTPKAEYLPDGEESKIFTLMFAPPGYDINMMRDAFRKVDQIFTPAVGQDPSIFENGETDVPALNFTIGFASSSRVFVVREASDRRHTEALMEAATRAASELPGLRSFSSRGSIFSGNFGGTRSMNIEVSAADLETLFDAGSKVSGKAREIFINPRIRSTPSNLNMGQPMLEIRPDSERAAELGILPGDLGYTVWANSDGAYVDDFFVGDDEIDMFIYSTTGNIERPQDLRRLMLYSPKGGVVPLSAVANLEETVNTETINRVDGNRTITLSVIPPREVPLEEAVQRVRDEIINGLKQSGTLPPKVNLRISGASDRLDATQGALYKNFWVALLIAYLLMVAVFSHWGYPLLIMASVPVGVSGGIAGLFLLNLGGAHLDKIGLYPIHQPFDMITMLGFLVLIGTVVNNPILIVERAVRNRRDAGMSPLEAVNEAIKVRLRPIMMSMVMTVAGLSPLVFNPGAGTELYRGLGAIVLFGLLFSTVVTLSFMPALLSLMLRMTRPREDAGTSRGVGGGVEPQTLS